MSCPPQDLTPNAQPPQVTSSFIAQDDPRFPHVHCSTIQVSRTSQYATWFGGSHEGADDIKVWFSKRESSDDKWQDAQCIAGSNGSIVHWNPVCFLPDRDAQPDWVVVFFKKGTPIPKWITYWIESHDGGQTWSDPLELVPGDRSGGRGPQKNPVIVLSNGDWASGASYEVTNGEGSEAYGVWDSFADIAPKPGPDDNWRQGDKWIKSPLIELPSDRGKQGGSFPGEGVIQPSLWEDPEKPGNVSMFMRSSNTRIQRADSTDFGRTFGPAYDTPLYNNNSGMCVTQLRDGRLVCAHNPIGKSWGPRTPLILAISSDKGVTWKHWVTLEDRPVEGDFEKIVALESGIVSDGRSEFSVQFSMMADDSYPTVCPTDKDDVDGVWVTYTWQRRGVALRKVFEG